MTLDARCGNALISYCRYLGKMFWPTNLSVFYPRARTHWPLAEVLLAGGVLLGISWVLFVARRRSPWLLMGWLWFVGTLVPVIGLVQVGEQSIADRYTYLPSLGVLILAICGRVRTDLEAGSISLRSRCRLAACMAIMCFVHGVDLAATAGILVYGHRKSLFQHALAVTENNHIAHNEPRRSRPTKKGGWTKRSI